MSAANRVLTPPPSGRGRSVLAHSLTARMSGVFEGVCLCGLAGTVFSLAASDRLWYFINPRYQTVTLASAVVMAALGVFAALSPTRPARPLRPLALAALLCLSWLGGAQEIFGPQTGEGIGVGQGVLASPDASMADSLISLPPEESQAGIAAGPGQAGEAGRTGEAAPGSGKSAARLKQSRETRDGREYIRINLGELFDIAAAKRQDRLALGYVVQGFVQHAGNDAVIHRTALYCCFADATAVGFRLKTGKLALPPDGTWIKVYGKLEPAPAGKPPKLDGGAFSSINPDYVFAAATVEVTPQPRPPFMFEWRSDEPYAY